MRTSTHTLQLPDYAQQQHHSTMREPQSRVCLPTEAVDDDIPVQDLATSSPEAETPMSKARVHKSSNVAKKQGEIES